ncbi:HNH endonuclease [Allokutzneria sp. A3M-2-11 16]|uniref:HNH endonuclease n=1 Tax=Allokutzneria sp. A3M-2-11 16 TaxID=2962043 RepID=UPI0020B8FDA2|nr:HNH endonuclease [Allokutzneria sp. A3M-2-11 16]MCP3805387.1 HNH endonuclease [Allokutzneria sp. A3M-2-11 16]
MARSKGRTGRPFRRVRWAVLTEHQVCVCHLCGHPIDLDLPREHPMSATVDHLDPLSRDGAELDPENMAPAHRRCNARRGNRPLGEAKRSRTSRAW